MSVSDRVQTGLSWVFGNKAFIKEIKLYSHWGECES